MQFVEEIKHDVETKGALSIITDLDGVVAEYRFGEGENIRNNIAGVFENKRPLKSIINLLHQVSKINGIELYIASSCFFEEQCLEKNHWVEKNMPFVKTQNRIFIRRHFELDDEMTKLKAINEQIIKKSQFSYLIDDSHTILFQARKKFNGRIKVYHVSTLIE